MPGKYLFIYRLKWVWKVMGLVSKTISIPNNNLYGLLFKVIPPEVKKSGEVTRSKIKCLESLVYSRTLLCLSEKKGMIHKTCSRFTFQTWPILRWISYKQSSFSSSADTWSFEHSTVDHPTCSMLTSLLLNEGLPFVKSSFNSSHTFLNLFYNSKTHAYDIVISCELNYQD